MKVPANPTPFTTRWACRASRLSDAGVEPERHLPVATGRDRDAGGLEHGTARGAHAIGSRVKRDPVPATAVGACVSHHPSVAPESEQNIGGGTSARRSRLAGGITRIE